MSHPFRVSQKYRNRKGEYEVVSIEGDKMVIHYVQGGTLNTTIADQQRILENMAAEDSVKPIPPKGAQSPAPSSSRSGSSVRESKFQGLVDSDFKDNVAGTSWRAKDHLGGLLAQQLTRATGEEYKSFALYRLPELHVVQPKYYTEPAKEREAKFRFRLDDAAARYGFYIEHIGAEMDKTYDWQRFIPCLERDEAVQRQVEHAMRKLDLHWEVWEGPDLYMEPWLKAEEFGGEIMLSHLKEDWQLPFSWPRFVATLKELDSKKWFGVFLYRHMPKTQVIAKGLDLAGDVDAVWKALVPLYVGSTR